VTQSEEQFDIFSADGLHLGQASRSRVHREGLWHKSAQIFLYDPDGRLYLQRRAADKDICADLWDQSVAEHLQPGETYIEAARRGLNEELGVTGVALAPLGTPFAGRLDQPELGVRDYELQQAFEGIWGGPVEPDPMEVAEIRAVDLAALGEWMRSDPRAFTPWFRRDAIRLGVLADL
jgi:isopentenyl-diphosphate delta-isomerase